MLSLFLVKKGPGLGHFLPFLGVAKEKGDLNTCLPCMWKSYGPSKRFHLGLVESGARLPCLAFFGQKRSSFELFLPFLFF